MQHTTLFTCPPRENLAESINLNDLDDIELKEILDLYIHKLQKIYKQKCHCDIVCSELEKKLDARRMKYNNPHLDPIFISNIISGDHFYFYERASQLNEELVYTQTTLHTFKQLQSKITTEYTEVYTQYHAVKMEYAERTKQYEEFLASRDSLKKCSKNQ